MGEVTAAHVEMAAARMTAREEVGRAALAVEALPWYRLGQRCTAKRQLKTVTMRWDDKLQALWLSLIQDVK